MRRCRALVRQRRTKDLLIDHMLRQYGYRVFRIGVAEDAARLDVLVGQVLATLASLVRDAAGETAREVRPHPQALGPDPEQPVHEAGASVL